MKVYKEMAKAIGARARCLESGNNEWAEKHENRVLKLLELFPRGSGFDCGTKIDLDRSNDDRLVFTTSFHHMNEVGMYDGWSEHTVSVLPSLGLDFHLKVSGRDRNGIKEYIGEMFSQALTEDCDQLV